MKSYASLRNYVFRSFDAEKLKFIAEEGFNAGINEGNYDEDTVSLFDSFTTEIWDHIYLGSQKHQMTVAQYLDYISYSEHEIETIQGFKNLVVWHAIERIACNILNNPEEFVFS